jgi:hypothetical protein
VKVEYVPGTTTAAGGLVHLAYLSDPNTRDYPADEVEMNGITNSTQGVPWTPNAITIPHEGLNMRKNYTVETHITDPLEMFCCAGQVLIATRGVPVNELLGIIMIKYEIEFDLPTTTHSGIGQHYGRWAEVLPVPVLPTTATWIVNAKATARTQGVTVSDISPGVKVYTIHSTTPGNVYRCTFSAYSAANLGPLASPFSVPRGELVQYEDPLYGQLATPMHGVSGANSFTTGYNMYRVHFTILVRVDNDRIKPEIYLVPSLFYNTTTTFSQASLVIDEPPVYVVKNPAAIMPLDISTLLTQNSDEEEKEESDYEYTKQPGALR